ncbi:hypothetical protein SKAU_G00106840 [Synaphobranchus kaupii]|uniref:Uncharacterized protein n=1 Tax=Synaphobranchus kaupii TaxID=118154 RepID=A0A9Q1G0Q1_SYNKA|nr:hypothetical protein SKAU_G00106840 [Synaphobranchus kaupii]
MPQFVEQENYRTQQGLRVEEVRDFSLHPVPEGVFKRFRRVTGSVGAGLKWPEALIKAETERVRERIRTNVLTDEAIWNTLPTHPAHIDIRTRIDDLPSIPYYQSEAGTDGAQAARRSHLEGGRRLSQTFLSNSTKDTITDEQHPAGTSTAGPKRAPPHLSVMPLHRSLCFQSARERAGTSPLPGQSAAFPEILLSALAYKARGGRRNRAVGGGPFLVSVRFRGD